ncbi:MAG: cation-translocating P-type ATPase, partial [Bacteroidota bacterium]
GIAGIVVSAIVILSCFLSRGNLLHAMLTGLSSAMAILPEEFPVVLTVFMALGAWRLSGRQVLTRNPAAIETLGAATVLCSDKTGTITENRMRVAVISDGVSTHTLDDSDGHLLKHPDLVKIAALACPEHPIDPMEKAIREIVGVAEPFRLIKTYPLTRERLSMTQVCEQSTGDDQQPGRVIAAKGAVEAISALCHLSPEMNSAIRTMADRIAAEGLRVIAVAQGMAEEGDLPEDADGFEYRFLGLIGLEDPIRPEVPAAMEECKKAGVRVIMITGDYPVTAASIGAKIGLDHQRIMTGSQVSDLDDESLQRVLHHTSVFARVVPEQKLRIVKALKANGEVVAMTGDGVNDAPALKAAHIGIAMGQKGTDVAREASPLVLLDDNFASIVRGLRLGRRIYDNLQKAMRYILAIHIPIIGLALLPAFVPAWPTLLFPLHIVFMELIIDPVCSIAFENEPDEAGLMNRPPRPRDAEFFGNREIITGVVSGLILLATVLGIYFTSPGEGHTEKEVRALAYTSLILCNIGFVLTSLSRTRNVFKVLGEHNPSAKIILASALFMLGLTLGSGTVRELFQFEVPGWRHFLPPVAGAAIMVVLFEARKWLVNRNLKSLPVDHSTSMETGQ